MFEKLEVNRMAQSLAAHAGARLGIVAKNIAHADTPGYRDKDLRPFAEVYATADPRRAMRPVEQRSAMDPNGNSVGLDAQMARMAEIRQSHDMALTIQRSTSAVIRAALGRGGQ